MPVGKMLGGGTPRGPVATRYKVPGVVGEQHAECLGWSPPGRCQFFQDFVGAKNEVVLSIGAGQVATTGTNTTFIVVPRAGVLSAAYLVGEDTLAANDTNYVTLSLTNRLASGSGSTAMLAATDANTSKATGGSAITAKAQRSLTVHGTAANLRVAEGDILEFNIAATGTLANVVDDATLVLRIETLPENVYPRTVQTAGQVLNGYVDDTACGEAVFQFSATNEAQLSGIDFGDQLCIDIRKRPVISFRAKVGTVTTAQRLVAGLASAYNATFDSTTYNLWFRLEAALDLLVEADDNTTNTDDTDTTYDITANTYYVFTIDASDLNSIDFWIKADGSEEVKVYTLTTATAFADLSAANAAMQFVFWLQKASGTGTISATLDWLMASWDRE